MALHRHYESSQVPRDSQVAKRYSDVASSKFDGDKD
jgi:hypothetical protein